MNAFKNHTVANKQFLYQ